jgi:hypothetical protein
MRRPTLSTGRSFQGSMLWDFLTFERLITGAVVHLIYWCGLGLIALAGFSILGAAIGLAIREASLISWLLAIPVLIGGLLVVAAFSLIWRGFCEFFVAVFRISDDLRALRRAEEARGGFRS